MHWRGLWDWRGKESQHRRRRELRHGRGSFYYYTFFSLYTELQSGEHKTFIAALCLARAAAIKHSPCKCPHTNLTPVVNIQLHLLPG